MESLLSLSFSFIFYLSLLSLSFIHCFKNVVAVNHHLTSVSTSPEKTAQQNLHILKPIRGYYINPCTSIENGFEIFCAEIFLIVQNPFLYTPHLQ